MRKTLHLVPLALLCAAALQFQPNYDEAKVPAYELPDPLRFPDGAPVKDAVGWWASRRSQILNLFENEVYGKAPGRPLRQWHQIRSREDSALGGKAVRKEVRISLTGHPSGPFLDLLVYQPRSKGPHPTFLGLNFYGNQTIHPDPGITITTQWVRNDQELGITENRATEKSRGARASQWPVEMILNRGYALATAYYGDIDPDFDDGFQNGIHKVYLPTYQRVPAPDQWGSIAAWAWGLSRIMDYIEKDSELDARRVAVMGHSRLGKTALWAGATDHRFAMVVSNNSGCGGAALSRRRFGETVAQINTAFPHWFCGNFKRYNDRENELPVDQHMLLALIAPRPLYVASAADDLWADPRGEFLAALAADPVYRLLGVGGLGVQEMPEVNQPVGDVLRYHIRSGGHDVTDFDWTQYLDLADRHMVRRGR
ncbi:MAG: acetylxylan esterase [Acidobacteriota bacterium]